VHPISRGQLSELVRLQLLRTPGQDCDCLIDGGYSGAIGYLFKITLTGYGYTFVAKGVQSRHWQRLVRESRVYREPEHLQGQLVPVHLGLVEVAVPYPMVNSTLVTHMMLLSYAGLSLYSEWLERRAARLHLDVDWDWEAERTAQELRAAGLVDEDEYNMKNTMWCEDTQRAMRIDFDRAYTAVPSGRRGSSCSSYKGIAAVRDIYQRVSLLLPVWGSTKARGYVEVREAVYNMSVMKIHSLKVLNTA
jgi:hypothetical protein